MKPKTKPKLLLCTACKQPGDLVMYARKWWHAGCWRARKPLVPSQAYPNYGSRAAAEMIAQGKLAFEQGLTETDCPYIGTFRALWVAGFNAARKRKRIDMTT